MNWAALQSAIATQVAAVTGLTVTWANQNAQRPAYPFAELNVISESAIGRDSVTYEFTGGVLVPTISGQRQFTVSVRVWTASQAGGSSARSYLSTLRTSMRKASVLEALTAAGLSLVAVEASQTVDQQIDQRWYSVGLMDLRFAAVENLTDSNGNWIETVEAEGTLPPTDLVIDGSFSTEDD